MARKPVEMVQRFNRIARFEHAAIITLFALLLLTGFPQKWPFVGASRWIISELGGIWVVRWIHRAAGVAFAVLTLAHLGRVIGGIATRKMRATMLLERKDFTDAIDSLRYYLGRSEKPPRFDRFDYRQKFEYWGLVFGSIVMVATGFLLFFPIAATHFLPAELIPAAKVMHSNEALLAFLIVLVWHMYGAHLSPEVFPFDSSIFTGRISKERLRHEHPLEHDRLFEEK